MKYSNIIINADDYGYNSNINEAILYCFNNNLINSTTILVNMPGFNEAVSIAKKAKYDDKIGLHINLTEGFSLTDLTDTRLVDKNGMFIKEAISNPMILGSTTVKNKIQFEILEQYSKLINTGIFPTHIDSHQHIHTLPWIAPIFIKLAKDKKTKLRIAKIVKRKNFLLTFYLHLLNQYFKFSKINYSDKFGNLDFLKTLLQKEEQINSRIEIMVHPTYKEGIIYDFSENIDLHKKINTLKQKYHLSISKNPFDSA